LEPAGRTKDAGTAPRDRRLHLPPDGQEVPHPPTSRARDSPQVPALTSPERRVGAAGLAWRSAVVVRTVPPSQTTFFNDLRATYDSRVEFVYIGVAATFGYLATLFYKRYEVERSIAIEIDGLLQDVLDDALLDTATSDHDLLNSIIARLRSAGHRTALLSPRVRGRVQDQVEVTTALAYRLWDRDHAVGPWLLQLSIATAREVLAPLIRAPGLLPRRPGKPMSFPDLRTFTRMMEPGGGGYDAALEWGQTNRSSRGVRWGT
jgi:hypothetical protein